MVDLNAEFAEFDSAIKLTAARKDKIKLSRNTVREKIRTYYKEVLNEKQPSFHSQGSFTINTALNPIDDNEVDIDDGVYLNNVDLNTEWPKPSESHNNIIEALKDHTDDGCESKSNCVRVIYKNFYHLDLPVYIMKENKAYIANTKSERWINSDSKEFSDWFYKNRKEEQNTRIIRYLKAWRDYLDLDLSSIEITILGIKEISSYPDRDDISLMNTVNAIANYLRTVKSVYKPVSPYEDLWSELTEKEKENRIGIWDDLYSDIYNAMNATSRNRASILLQAVFGNRFPYVEEDKRATITTVYESGAKPWGK